MKILTNKKIKSLFCVILVCILIFLLVSALLIMTNDRNANIHICAAALLSFAAMITALCRYFSQQNKIIEKAEAQITEYIAGNRGVRIECGNEGELYKLFHKINSLVSILNSHAEKETNSKEFLKNTISDISHQLKTPLAAINIYNGIIQNESNAPAIQEFTSLTEQELDRIESLVQNLLKITKLDAGMINLDKKPENVSEMMNEIKKRFVLRGHQEGKEINVTGSNDITLLCDKCWLTEAIGNIVKNALDHTAEGGKIQIEYKQLPSAVQIIIKDNGSGIHPEDFHHIFKRFYRSRFSKDTLGTGLGLPLAKTIIEEHNGSIEVYSEPGKGTTFIVNFLT